jgi:hypothetical protein
MDVFVIPIGRDRYELYCESADDPDAAPEPPQNGFFGQLRFRFSEMLRAAEARQRDRNQPSQREQRRWITRLQERIMAWVAERIAEQRLLWNLRRETTATIVHPEDMTYGQVMTLVRRMLERDHERHKVWLVVDTLGLIGSAALTLLPGPNLIAYYFAFRVVGHWLSMRGASQGLNTITWVGKPCPPLTELRQAATLDPNQREQRVNDIASRLRLEHLPTFFERVVVPHA